MSVELVRCLEKVREVYNVPKGMERFKAYLRLVGTDDGMMALPLSMLNPMAKPHALERVEQLIAIAAEDLSLEAARVAASELDGDDALRVIIVLMDDAMGGWTNRAFAEFAYRYERMHEVERGWASVNLWTSEEPTAELVAMRARESVYRTLDERRNGQVKTLREILDREGHAMRFAGHSRLYDDSSVAAIREKMQPHLDSTAAPTLFALLYGDEMAESLGYPALGVPDRGGYDLALATDQ